MLSEHRDLAAAKTFFRSAKTVIGITPARVTTDGHDAYPPAIRTELGRQVRHQTSCYLNNRLEQDHRGIKGRCRPMLGLSALDKLQTARETNQAHIYAVVAAGPETAATLNTQLDRTLSVCQQGG
jgi:transposase-like protein